jgi:hypothetical protein
LPDDSALSERATELGETNVLKWMDDEFEDFDLDFEPLCVLACATGQDDTLEWLVATAKDYKWFDENELRDCFAHTIKHGKASAVQAVHNATGGFVTPGPWKDEMVKSFGCYMDKAYGEACPLAAARGKLPTLKLLKSLGYEFNERKIMLNALRHKHMHVAEWVVEHRPLSWPSCTVEDMHRDDAPGWCWSRLRDRDPEIHEHKHMCAYKHLMEYTLEREDARTRAKVRAAMRRAEGQGRGR